MSGIGVEEKSAEIGGAGVEGPDDGGGKDDDRVQAFLRSIEKKQGGLRLRLRVGTADVLGVDLT